MSTAALEVIGITKNFPQRELLRGIELSLAAGGRYVLTGDNGCGKTTLLRIVVGLESADSGEMRVDGSVVSLGRYPEALRRKLIYVHQHPYLFHTSINHNIAYGLKARNEPANDRQAMVEDAIRWAGVGHLTGVLPQNLSGGEKQRVALARAKVLNPHLLLLDEPTASLDSEARRHAIELIDKLCADGVTVLIACHDREIIEMPGMKRLHLESGRIATM